MSEETSMPIPSETGTPESELEPTPVQLELTEIQRLIRETIADVIAVMPEPQIPAGGNTPYVIDADALPTSEKIRRGLAMRDAR